VPAQRRGRRDSIKSADKKQSFRNRKCHATDLIWSDSQDHFTVNRPLFAALSDIFSVTEQSRAGSAWAEKFLTNDTGASND
jgi:hypothetical protein